MNEEWRVWRDGTYEVSSLGNVRRAKPGISTFVGRPVKPVASGTGYHQMQLGCRVYTHRVVAEVFLGECPDGHVVNHKDGDKTNNAVANLEYVTHKRNAEHAIEGCRRSRGPSMPKRPLKGRQAGDTHWTKLKPESIARGDKMPHSKLTAEMVVAAKSRVAAGETQSSVAAELGISVGQMSRVIRGTRWTYL